MPHHRINGVVGRDLSEALSRLKGVLQQHVYHIRIPHSHIHTQSALILIYTQYRDVMQWSLWSWGPP